MSKPLSPRLCRPILRVCSTRITLPFRSRAVAGLGNYTSACVIALDLDVARSMIIQGNDDFDVNCEIEVSDSGATE